MKYEVIRTDIADEGIRKIILYVAQNFGNIDDWLDHFHFYSCPVLGNCPNSN